MPSISIVQPFHAGPRARAQVIAGLALLLPLVTGACENPTAPEGEERPQLEYRSLHVGGFTRSYVLIRPVDSGDQPRPLLLIYHGSGGNAMDLVSHTSLAIKAVEAGMVVASLDAVPGYGGRWATNPVDLEVVDDVTFTQAVLETLTEELPLDPARVFAVGYSRGGEFVYQLACRAPEMVRGVAAVSAALLRSNLEWCGETAEGLPPVAVTMVLGTDDPIIPWGGGPTRLGALETLAHWQQRNGCPSSAVESSYPARTDWTVTLSRFTCAHGEVQFFRVAPLAHDWPGVAFDVDGAIIDAFMAN